MQPACKKWITKTCKSLEIDFPNNICLFDYACILHLFWKKSCEYSSKNLPAKFSTPARFSQANFSTYNIGRRQFCFCFEAHFFAKYVAFWCKYLNFDIFYGKFYFFTLCSQKNLPAEVITACTHVPAFPHILEVWLPVYLPILLISLYKWW